MSSALSIGGFFLRALNSRKAATARFSYHGAAGVQLGLRLSNVRFGGHATVEAISSQLQRVGVCLNGVLKQALLSVGATELEVVDRQLGL